MIMAQGRTQKAQKWAGRRERQETERRGQKGKRKEEEGKSYLIYININIY